MTHHRRQPRGTVTRRRRVRHASHLRAHVQRVPPRPRARAPEARDVADVVERRAPIGDDASSGGSPQQRAPRGSSAEKLRLPRGYPVRLRRRPVRDRARRAQGHVQHDLQGERPGPRLGRRHVRRAAQDRRRQGANDPLLQHREGSRAVQVAVAGGHGGAPRVDQVHAPAQDGPFPAGGGVREAPAEARGATTGQGGPGRWRQGCGVLHVKRKSRQGHREDDAARVCGQDPRLRRRRRGEEETRAGRVQTRGDDVGGQSRAVRGYRRHAHRSSRGQSRGHAGVRDEEYLLGGRGLRRRGRGVRLHRGRRRREVRVRRLDHPGVLLAGRRLNRTTRPIYSRSNLLFERDG
mmetsp:Transcript_13072/g.51117  ORF Transcript_13072/g.51117 Transcript_13072/m.51117 type:complete len:349 (-) Transcript_13072:214-1260(-)